MKQTLAKQLIQAHARSHQQPRAAPFRKCEHPKKEQRDQRHNDQGGRTLRNHHTVVDLQHVNGGREHEQIGNHAKDTRSHEFASEAPKRSCQLIAIEKFWHFHFEFFFLCSRWCGCW